ncbi:hypothetical protein [Sphingomonas oryzagri]
MVVAKDSITILSDSSDMDQKLIEDAIAHARDRGLTVGEALAHWELAGGAQSAKRSAHWVTIAFGIARNERRVTTMSDRSEQGAPIIDADMP